MYHDFGVAAKKNLCQNLKILSDFFLVSFSTSFIDFRLYLLFFKD